jgi:hypothetical protein
MHMLITDQMYDVSCFVTIEVFTVLFIVNLIFIMVNIIAWRILKLVHMYVGQ